jgi:hypothetical protein
LVVGQFIFIRVSLFKKRVYRARFELIRKNPRSKRKINDSIYSFGGKKNTSILLAEITRIKITVSIRRFTDKFRHISKDCWTKDIKMKSICEGMVY